MAREPKPFHSTEYRKCNREDHINCGPLATSKVLHTEGAMNVAIESSHRLAAQEDQILIEVFG